MHEWRRDGSGNGLQSDFMFQIAGTVEGASTRATVAQTAMSAATSIHANAINNKQAKTSEANRHKQATTNNVFARTHPNPLSNLVFVRKFIFVVAIL